MEYARTITLDLPYDQAVPRVKEAFAEQGFGTLTEIDVRATLKNKIGEDIEDYVILGACNPHLAHRALDIEREIGLLLPCNVVVRAAGTGRPWSRRWTRGHGQCAGTVGDGAGGGGGRPAHPGRSGRPDALTPDGPAG